MRHATDGAEGEKKTESQHLIIKGKNKQGKRRGDSVGEKTRTGSV